MIKTVYEKILTRAKKAIKDYDLIAIFRLKSEVITAQSLGAFTCDKAFIIDDMLTKCLYYNYNKCLAKLPTTLDYIKLRNGDIETIDTFTQVR